MTYIYETLAWRVMCTAECLHRHAKTLWNRSLADTTAPKRGDEDGLELFGEAARELGEQRPAQKHGDDTDQRTRTEVVPTREPAVIHAATETLHKHGHRVQFHDHLNPVRHTALDDLWCVDNRGRKEPHLREDLPEVPEVSEVHIGRGEAQCETCRKQCEQEHLQHHHWQPRQEDAARDEQGNGE